MKSSETIPLRAFWQEYLGDELDEEVTAPGPEDELTYRDLAVLWALAKTPGEKHALRKALALLGQYVALVSGKQLVVIALVL